LISFDNDYIYTSSFIQFFRQTITLKQYLVEEQMHFGELN